jgi:RNA polymerase sigma-70 factor (ECF subfamily)
MEPADFARFDAAILPHLDAAHNLARHLTGSASDADDVVQDACLRALRHFGGFIGTDGRAWFLTITRNAAYDFGKRFHADRFIPLDDVPEDVVGSIAEDVTDVGAHGIDWQQLDAAVQSLPAEFREVIVLREVEGLSYAEIANIAGIPMGTVMSRLARARRRLRTLLAEPEETR